MADTEDITFDFGIICKSREELKVYTTNYCNRCNRTAVLDHSKNNGHRAVYICKERLNGVECPFKVVWTKRVHKNEEVTDEWRPRIEQSCLTHTFGICCGSAEMNRAQVLSDPKLCSIVSAQKKSKRKALPRNILL